MSYQIESSFARIGARATVRRLSRNQAEKAGNAFLPISVSIVDGKEGQSFTIERLWNTMVEVAETVDDDRHLLLVATNLGKDREVVSTFLCGYDERAYFVAAIPESAKATSVQAAKDALKPQEVWDSIREHDVPMDQRDVRCTAAFLRQGEWYFLPRPWMEIDRANVLENEPIRRGNGNPHVCEFLTRTGGEDVHVSREHPNGLTWDEFQRLDPIVRNRQVWSLMRREGDTHVCGRITHKDHQTIELPYWHKVVMNTETKSRAMSHMRFLD